MKNINILIALVILLIISSCNTLIHNTEITPYNKSLEDYLIGVVNDTSVVMVNSLDIVDSTIFSILDTVIYSMENCDNYDKRIKYLYGTSIRPTLYDDSIISYNIYCHDFISDILERPNIVGGFYYRNYFFIVFDPYKKAEESLIGFCKKNGCKLRVKPTKAYRFETYYDMIEFRKSQGSQYVITKKRLCGPLLLL